jgi:hypothetical protein
MDADAVLDPDDAKQAVSLLLPVLADSVDAAGLATAADVVAERSVKLAELFRDAAVLADAVGVITRRAER